MARTFITRILAPAAAVLALPLLASAAYNDVSGTATVPVGSVNYAVSGIAVESITVSSGSMSFVLLPNSTVDIIDGTGRAMIATGGEAYIVTDSCSSSGSSELQYSVPAAGSAATVTISPSGSSCSVSARNAAASSSSGSGSSGNGAPAGGGGGGGGSSSPVPTTTTTTNTTANTSSNAALIAQLQTQIASLVTQLNALLVARGLPPVNLAALINASSNASFKRDLELGSTGDDVKALQVYLNAHGYAVAQSGVGSSGKETTKFGNATKAALIRLQKAAGISPTSGYFGAKTRAYIAAHP